MALVAAQFEVFGRYGQFVARLDMAYEDVQVGVEYDGADPAVRQRDIDRHFALAELGWLVIRVSRDMMRYRRRDYVSRVATALRERGVGRRPIVNSATGQRSVAS